MKTTVKKLPTFIKDNIKRVSIREYLRHYTSYNDEINETGKKIMITSQDKDLVLISPAVERKIWTLEDLRKMQFDGGDPNMSNDIDKIVYGI